MGHLKKLEKDNTHKEYELPILFRCLILQFMEDLSDREIEIFLEENLAAKIFVDFTLTDNIPDHTVLCRDRGRIGTSFPSKIFQDLRKQLSHKRFDEVSEDHLWEIEKLLNNRPRKVLKFRTPEEVFHHLSQEASNVALCY